MPRRSRSTFAHSNSGSLSPKEFLSPTRSKNTSGEWTVQSRAKYWKKKILRARQTAQMVGKATGASIQIAPELIEYHVGIYEGTSTLPGSAGAIADWEIKKRWYLHQDLDAPLPGGESLNQMRARFMPFVNTALDRYNRESGIVLMISHGGLMVAMLPLVFENIDFAFTQSHQIDHLRPIKGEVRERRFWCVEFDGEIPPGASSLRSCLLKADGA